MPVHVGGRNVYLRQGRLTQTVNICRPDNRRGEYERTYVLAGPENFVSEEEVAAFVTVPDLEAWLVERAATLRAGGGDAPADPVEPPAAGASHAAAAGYGPPPAGLAGADAEWAAEAAGIVEAAIDELLLEFARRPNLHRVEHSMHARLFALLCDRPLFAQHVPLAGGRDFTQVLHKEWPETVPRGGGRRGNFDLALLPPGGIGRATVDQFLEGRIAPCIAVEMGLDYDDGHLLGDHAKLLNSGVPRGYLMHLARDPAHLAREEEAVLRVHAAGGGVRIGYAAAVGGQRRLKMVGADRISVKGG